MTKGSPWQLSRAAISAIERGQNFPGMEAMLALSNVLHVDPKELIERARLCTTVPVDLTGHSYEDLDKRAARYFWAGDFRKALSVYDAMLELLALRDDLDPSESRRRVADLEVRRATALRRAGALLAAIATAERAISLSEDAPGIQAEAYIVLASLQAQRGHLPLASDAAERAVALAGGASAKVQGWAWMIRAKVHFLSGRHEDARQAYLEARKKAREAEDHLHLTHIEGDVGMCWLEMGQVAEARKWVVRAIDLARQQGQPALEASWLVELGKIALHDGDAEEADSYAQASLRIAKRRDHHLTVFRAEWLRHSIVRATQPDRNDRHRLAYLRRLYQNLDQHDGVPEVLEFKRTAFRSLADEGGTP